MLTVGQFCLGWSWPEGNEYFKWVTDSGRNQREQHPQRYPWKSAGKWSWKGSYILGWPGARMQAGIPFASKLWGQSEAKQKKKASSYLIWLLQCTFKDQNMHWQGNLCAFLQAGSSHFLTSSPSWLIVSKKPSSLSTPLPTDTHAHMHECTHARTHECTHTWVWAHTKTQSWAGLLEEETVTHLCIYCDLNSGWDILGTR